MSENVRNQYSFPEKELNNIFKQFPNIETPFNKYLDIILESGIPEDVCNVIAHVIVEYIKYLIAINKPEYSSFLLPQNIDPFTYKQNDCHSDLVLVADWEAQHTARNKQEASIIVRRILEGKPGQTWFITGCMYSAKSDLVLEVVRQLVDRAYTGRIESFIAEVLEEKNIVSRRGGRGRSSPYKETRELSAQPLREENIVSSLDISKFRSGDIVIIDEISFITWSEEICKQVNLAIQKLNDNGIFVILSGLDTNYRSELLPFPKYLENENIHTLKLNAFVGYIYEDKLVVEDAVYTSRLDNIAGFIDLLLPVPIGRIHSGMVQYVSVPRSAHIFAVIKEINPELYEDLIAVGNQIGLFSHHEKYIEVET